MIVTSVSPAVIEGCPQITVPSAHIIFTERESGRTCDAMPPITKGLRKTERLRLSLSSVAKENFSIIYPETELFCGKTQNRI